LNSTLNIDEGLAGGWLPKVRPKMSSSMSWMYCRPMASAPA